MSILADGPSMSRLDMLVSWRDDEFDQRFEIEIQAVVILDFTGKVGGSQTMAKFTF